MRTLKLFLVVRLPLDEEQEILCFFFGPANTSYNNNNNKNKNNNNNK